MHEWERDIKDFEAALKYIQFLENKSKCLTLKYLESKAQLERAEEVIGEGD